MSDFINYLACVSFGACIGLLVSSLLFSAHDDQ